MIPSRSAARNGAASRELDHRCAAVALAKIVVRRHHATSLIVVASNARAPEDGQTFEMLVLPEKATCRRRSGRNWSSFRWCR
jgi:hypothetical protein